MHTKAEEQSRSLVLLGGYFRCPSGVCPQCPPKHMTKDWVSPLRIIRDSAAPGSQGWCSQEKCRCMCCSKGWLIMGCSQRDLLGKEQSFIQGPYVVVMAYFNASAVCQLSIVYWGSDGDPLKDEHRSLCVRGMVCVGASWIRVYNCCWQDVCLDYFVRMGVTNDH